jgi:signal transduction histidine kinase/HD-like signal output (HDOD) protein
MGQRASEQVSSTAGAASGRAGQIELILRQIETLPTLAPVAMRLIRIGNIEDADLDQIVEAIESDPPLTARLLGLCRRAETGLGDRVSTLRRAVVMLGLEAVQAAALSVAVFEVMHAYSPRADEQLAGDAGPEGTFDRTGFWRHCIAVATASERIAEAHPHLNVRPEEAFVAGLLHGIGKLALHVVLPRAYARVLGLAERRHCSSAEVEMQVLGIDHHAAGRRIAEHWGLPPALRDVIWLQGQPWQAMPDLPHRQVILTVGVARALCGHLHLGWSGDFNHPAAIDGPRGLCARSGGALDPAAVDHCASGLHEAMLIRCRALGLGDQETPELLMQSLAAANRRLGRLSADMRSRTLANQAQTTALAAIRVLHQAGPSSRDMVEALSAIVSSARQAFGEGFYATVHQEQEGEPWHLSTFGREGQLLRSCAIETPQGRDSRHCLSLAELGRAHTTLKAMGALPWLTDHLLEAPDLGRIQVLSLCDDDDSRRPSGAAVLLHDTAPLHDPRAMGALTSAWAAAFAAAAQQEAARRFADQLAAANRAVAEAEANVAEMQALARLGEMTAGAAHEMNNPLAVISGRAEMLAEQAAAASDREIASAIVEAARRLSDLITAMNAIANPPTPEPCRALVGDAVLLALQRATARLSSTASPTVHLEDPGAEANIDPEIVSTALAELIANALEAAPRGNVRISTHIAPVDRRLILTVVDDGPGMSPRAQQHAFDPFFSECPAGRRTGLGLTRARRLVELHGGHLKLQSIPGVGTTATIEIPQHGPEGISADRFPSEAPAADPELARPHTQSHSQAA